MEIVKESQEDLNIESSELQKQVEEREQSEKEYKFVIIGGNEPLVNKHFIEAMKNSGVPINVFELDNEEMKFIINSRAQKTAEEMSVDYLQKEENKKQVNDWVKLLCKNHIEKLYPKSERAEAIDKCYSGELSIVFSKKTLKDASQLSWSNFNELFATLQLFNVVKYLDEELTDFILILNEEDITENQIIEIKQFIKLTIGKIDNLKESKLTKIQVKKFKSQKIKLQNIFESL